MYHLTTSHLLSCHLTNPHKQLWTHPSKRGNYQTCYESDFFRDVRARGPIFDILPELSCEERMKASPGYARRELPEDFTIRVDYAYADPDLRGEKINVSWIRPGTELFNVQREDEDQKIYYEDNDC